LISGFCIDPLTVAKVALPVCAQANIGHLIRAGLLIHVNMCADEQWHSLRALKVTVHVDPTEGSS